MPFKLIFSLAGLGVLDTAYLTLSKYSNLPLACPASGPVSGCQTVLDSDWASFFGVPMSLLGLATYSTVATLAAIGSSRQAACLDERDDSTTSALRSAMLGGGVVLATCSAFLMFILFTEFPGELCPWCLASAALSAAVLTAALRGHSGSELGRAAGPGSAAMAGLALVLALNFSNIQQSQAQADGYYEIPYQEPPITTESSPRAVTLAKRLKEAGARMYGAFWCSHCYDQKEAFGKQAMADFPYVECYPDGFMKGTKMASVCTDAGIKGFPTWVLGGEILEGEQPFDVLEDKLTKVAAAAAAQP